MDDAAYREQLNALEAELSDVYRRRRELLERFADDYPPVLPPPRLRTDAQQRVARCPRCSARLSEKDGVEN